jgi:hypothetical protein
MKPKHFAPLNLPEPTVRWLLDFWSVIQGLDDWRDNDEVSPQEKEAVIYKVMFLLPNNPFFQYHSKELLPIVSNLVLRWIGANRLEDNREDLHKAYMWRAAYYDLILEVVRLVHGFEAAANASDFVARLYGETFEDYVREFQNA